MSTKIKKARCGVCASTEALQQYRITTGPVLELNSTDYRMMCHVCIATANELLETDAIQFKGTSHHSRWASIKYAIKQHRGLGNTNLFSGHSG